MKIVLTGVACGFVVFIASFLTHVVFGIGSIGISTLPAEQETQIVQSMKAGLNKPGLYFFPGIDMTKAVSEEEMKAWAEKISAGPNGLVIYNPAGQNPMSSSQMGRQLFFAILGGLILAFIISNMNTSILIKAVTGGLMGIFAWLAVSLPQWNWYNFPLNYTLGVGLDRLLCWSIGGLFAAMMLRPREKHEIIEENERAEV